MAGPVEAKGMKLVSQNTLDGQGGVGEGMAMQRTKDGRRILWLAHEGPPTNFTTVDVTDPKNTKVIGRQNLPHNKVRSNSLEIVGDVMAVAYQTYELGVSPAGVELFDISVPENPKSISFFDCSGPHSRGVHQVWFADGEYIHFSGGGEGIVPRNPLDDQIYRIIDVRNPSKPVEVGRWHYPGTHKGDKEAPPPRHPKFDGGYRPHNINVYPERPDRAYVAYLDGGAVILDIADKSNPKMITNWRYSPPYNGFCHTVMPLLGRDLLLVTDECTKDDGLDWPKLGWVVNASVETNLVPMSTLPMPPAENFVKRGGRLVPTTSTRTCPGRLRSVPAASWSAPSSTAACARSTPRTRISPRRLPTMCPERPSSRPRARSRSMTCGWTRRDWSTPLTALPAAFTSSR